MRIEPSALGGCLRVIPSKSVAHRALILAAMSRGESRLLPLQHSRDVQATMRAMEALGRARMQWQEGEADEGFAQCTVQGGLPYAPQAMRTVDCGESGSTLRFLMPMALDGKGAVRFVGQGRLMQRPLEVYRELFAKQGILWTQEDDALVLEGQLRGGEFSLRGDVSSQFVTGLLLALPCLAEDSTLHITTALESRDYVEITRSVQAIFGIRSAWVDAQTLHIPGRQVCATPGQVNIEGDYSHAAFYLVAGALGEGICLTGLRRESTQGDRAIIDILQTMGADIAWTGDGLVIKPSKLTGTTIDASQIPDLVPILAVAACAAEGETRITGAARLRMKESDRLMAVAKELSALGAAVEELEDGLVIRGGRALRGGRVQGHNDHRIVMALCIAGVLCAEEIIVDDAQAVSKSAPRFFEEFVQLGGKASAWKLGE